MQTLPIDAFLAHIQHCSQSGSNLILTAAPGTGKSTRVPPALLEVHEQQILVLQPRRAAARSIARRIAAERQWELGKDIGWQVRYERKGTADTRLWIMTEGVLTRRLIKDPYLENVSCIVLDEFHERHIDTDIILAWVKNLQATVRPDLQLVVMSATLETETLQHYINKAQVIDVAGEQHDLQIHYRNINEQRRWIESTVREIKEASTNLNSGAILVFLPGVGEIKRCQQLLEDDDVDLPIQCLYGALSPQDQDAVLQDDSRRIILSTNIAETSLTVPGVRTVIDSGRERVAFYNADTGLDELRLQDCSQFSATQRAGRAAREDRGRCIRMWSKAHQQRRSQSSKPEIHRIDLAPIVMRLKTIHGDDVRTLPWFEAPEEERLQQAEDLLHLLQLSDGAFEKLSKAGNYAAGLPVHPRLARMLMFAATMECVPLAASIAAICSERDLRMHPKQHAYKADPGPSDIFDRLCIMHGGLQHDPGVDKRAVREALQARRDIMRAWGDEGGDIYLDHPDIHDQISRLLLSAWPDRVGKRSSGNANNGKMCGGVGVRFDEQSALHIPKGGEATELFVAAVIQGLRRLKGGAQYVRLGAEIDEADMQAVLGDCLQPHYLMRYREDQDKVQAQVVWRYLDLDIKFQQDAKVSDEQISQCLADALAPNAEAILRSDEQFDQYMHRLHFLRAHTDMNIPEINYESLVRDMCATVKSKKALLDAGPLNFVLGQIDYALQQDIDKAAPAQITLDNGRTKRLSYLAEKVPVLSIKIQDCFGQKETPRIANGQVPIKVELLAPNQRPAQITDDLASFWQNSYALVRKDLRGRYPKHDWPEQPHST